MKVQSVQLLGIYFAAYVRVVYAVYNPTLN